MKKLYALSDDELRKVQLQELEILKYVKKICDENEINYFLDWGTLLGAVRHKGFIPWDNDIDIGMLRKDYDKFCEVMSGAKNNRFILQNWYTDKNWPDSYSKVRDRNTVFITNHIESNQSEDYSGFDIDIFVYDNAPDNSVELKTLDKKLKHLQRLLFMKAGYRLWFFMDQYNLVKRIMYLPYQLLALFYKKQTLVDKYEKTVQGYPESETVFCHHGTWDIQPFDREVLSELTEVEFEGQMFKCPINFDYVLKKRYGNYMQLPPEDVQSQRSYALELSFSK